ncbi:alpha/beta hydrolase [Embleya sp. NPDC020630]|uniref:alpha/beta hydrolase n=1 Tax=Embleya sp. NPDC020630 TaxID=3363979 RepID=UPI00378C4299
MPLDPPIQRIIDLLADHRSADPPPGTPAERRELANATMRLAFTGRPDDVTATDHRIPVPGGEITVRILRPAGLPAVAPAFYFIHGGGWFQGDLDTAEVELGPITAQVACAVALVDYRLAPEHPYPTPLEDCVAGYTWLHAHHAELGLDPNRIAVGGCSAGGNLAALLCLVARDRQLPMPVAQLLDVPGVDLTRMEPSAGPEATADLGGLTPEACNEFFDLYLPEGVDPRDPRVSPLFEPDLSGLPPAVITIAEHDPLRDQGERYLTRLHEAGVPAAAFRVLAHLHGGWVIPGTVTHALVGDLRAASVRRALGGTLAP